MAEILLPIDHWAHNNAVDPKKDSVQNDGFLTGVKYLSAIVTVNEVLDDDLPPMVQSSPVTIRRPINFKTWPEFEFEVSFVSLFLSIESTDTSELLVPMSRSSRVDGLVDEPVRQSIFQEYLAYRSLVEPSLFHDRRNFGDRCRVEWETAFAGFRNIEDRNVQLCMAAWTALNMSLQDQCQTLTTENVALAIGVVAEMLNDFHEQSSPGERRRRLSHPSLTRLCHHTTQFRLFVTDLLTPSAIAGLKSRLHETLRGIYERAIWRETAYPENKAYLKIQSTCSGLSAMFYLAHMSTLVHLSPCSSSLKIMQRLVSVAAILQRDIVEIEASLVDNSLENYVLMTVDPSIKLLPSSLQSPCLAPSIKSSVNRYNKILHDVFRHYRHIHSDAELRHERTSADMLMDFLGAHLEWKIGFTQYLRQDNAAVEQCVDFCAIGTLQKILQDLK
ncbi:hypothetical protein LTR84_001193 [Exophiala bonariae]|uniref:Transcription factor domain-containing protein n=1 Tax=Exophiala bonariae TaxID=1690606 RepID=A0AAV9NWN9_9EURO|nr:hypothetical protein LTR84_001193 [Exophiala bonariae]